MIKPNALVNILMITYRRPDYVRMTLPALLESLDEQAAVWLWHNGDDEETLEVVSQYRKDSRVQRYFHSRENVRLRPPTNWLWTESSAELVGKVDDDCIQESGWIERLRQIHASGDFGIIGNWRFQPTDFRPDLCAHKIQRFAGGHEILRNLWVQGSGYLMPRRLADDLGPLAPEMSFTRWCISAAKAGAINGWPFPFTREHHLDDPRCPLSPLKTDEDLVANLPLSAEAHGVTSISQWTAQMAKSALAVQASSLDPEHYYGWRSKRRQLKRRVQRVVLGHSTW